MIKLSCLLLLVFNIADVSAGCLTESQLRQLIQQEIQYLTRQIPPAFKQALQAGTVKVEVKSDAITKPIDTCSAQLVVTLPQADIDAANAVLDAEPAKKIMLNAQGYGLPQSTTESAIFNVDATRLTIAHADILQTAPLGKLRASIELMYAFITQKHAQVTAIQTNNSAWPQALKDTVVASCSLKLAESVCTCIAEQYAHIIPANQMESIQYVRENPYALANASNQGFETLKQQAETSCKGKA